MNAIISIYIYTRTSICICTRKHKCLHAYLYAHVTLCVYVCECMCIYTRIQRRPHSFISVYTHIQHIHVTYVYTYIHIYVYTYIHTYIYAYCIMCIYVYMYSCSHWYLRSCFILAFVHIGIDVCVRVHLSLHFVMFVVVLTFMLYVHSCFYICIFYLSISFLHVYAKW